MPRTGRAIQKHLIQQACRFCVCRQVRIGVRRGSRKVGLLNHNYCSHVVQTPHGTCLRMRSPVQVRPLSPVMFASGCPFVAALFSRLVQDKKCLHAHIGSARTEAVAGAASA
jgi:hypothetical protein